MAVIKQGDTTLITFTLLKNGASFVITPTSIVEARFYVNGVLEGNLDTITCDDAEDGADWANSIVTVKLTSAETALLTIDDLLEPRISIVDDDSERITYTGRELSEIRVETGF